MNDLSEFINKVDLFFGLSEKDRDAVLKSGQEKDIKKKDLLFSAGAPAKNLCILKKGAVKTIRFANGSTKLLVDIFKPGDVIGEESVLLSGVYEVEARAFDSASVLFLPNNAIKDLMGKEPRLGMAMAALSASRARKYRERLFLVTASPVPIRIASALYTLARDFGKKDQKGTMIALKLTHQDLADYIGASRETVTLFLAKFKKEGLIKMNVRRIVVPDMKALKKAATPN